MHLSLEWLDVGAWVYKNFDPRAKVIKQICDKVLTKLGINDPCLEIAKQIAMGQVKITPDFLVQGDDKAGNLLSGYLMKLITDKKEMPASTKTEEKGETL